MQPGLAWHGHVKPELCRAESLYVCVSCTGLRMASGGLSWQPEPGEYGKGTVETLAGLWCMEGACIPASGV